MFLNCIKFLVPYNLGINATRPAPRIESPAGENANGRATNSTNKYKYKSFFSSSLAFSLFHTPQVSVDTLTTRYICYTSYDSLRNISSRRFNAFDTSARSGTLFIYT